MSRTSKNTLLSLGKLVASGACIADFYFAFLKEHDLRRLLDVAQLNRNEDFYWQVQRVVHGRKRPKEIFRTPEVETISKNPDAPEVITIRVHAKPSKKWPKTKKRKATKNSGGRWRSEKEKYTVQQRGQAFGGKASIVRRKH